MQSNLEMIANLCRKHALCCFLEGDLASWDLDNEAREDKEGLAGMPAISSSGMLQTAVLCYAFNLGLRLPSHY